MAESIAIIGADHTLVLTRLVAELKADINDLLADDGSFKPVDQWPLVWRQGLVAGMDVDELWEGSGKDRTQIGVTRKIKFANRTRRLELFGKHKLIRAFSERKTDADKANHTASSILAQVKPTSVGLREEDAAK